MEGLTFTVHHGGWAINTSINIYSNTQGESCLCFHYFNEWNMPSNSSALRMLFNYDEHGGRYIVEGIERNPQAAEILDMIKFSCISYYRKLIDIHKQGCLDQHRLSEEVEALVASCPVDRITSDSNGTMNFTRGFLLGYGLYAARSELQERFNNLDDAEYIESMKTLVDILKAEAGIVVSSQPEEYFYSQGYDAIGLFSCAFYLSLRLKLSNVCAYDDGTVFEAHKARLMYVDNVGERLNKLELLKFQDFMATYAGPGPGPGKSITIRLLSDIERLAGMLVYDVPHREDLNGMRDEIWELITKDEVALSLTGDVDEKYEIEQAIKEKFELYMQARLPAIHFTMLGFESFMRGKSEKDRWRCVAYMDTMGFPCLFSIIARSGLNSLLEEEYQDLKYSLENDFLIQIPDMILYRVKRRILNNRFLSQVLEATGRPVIVLDMPVNEAIQRSRSDRSEIRSRHDQDRASLRLLGLCLRELFPQDVIVIPCAYDEGRYLSRIQVACRCEFEMSFLRMGNWAREEIFWLDWVRGELEVLSRRLDIMSTNLEHLQGIH